MSSYKFGLMMAAMMPPENMSENLMSVMNSGMNLNDRNRTMFSVMNSNTNIENRRAQEKRTAKRVGLEVIEVLTTENVGDLSDKEFANKYKLTHKYGLTKAVREKDSEVVIIQELESKEQLKAELDAFLCTDKAKLKTIKPEELAEQYPSLENNGLLAPLMSYVK